MLLLTSLAFAADYACDIPFLGATPFPGQVGVPVNVVPSAVFGSWRCDQGDDWSIEILRADDDSLVAATTWEGEQIEEDRWITLPHEPPLDPGTDYVLRLDRLLPSGDVADTEERTFTTGSGTVAGLDGAPRLTALNVGYDASSGDLDVHWTAEPATDPDALSILQVAGDAFRFADMDPGFPCDAEVARDASEVDGNFRSPDPFPPEQTCLQVRQVDGLGRVSDWSEEVCAEVAGGTSCDASGGPGSVPAVGAAAWALALARRCSGTRRPRRA